MEQKEISLVILGVVSVIAVVGLVLLFKAAMSGNMVREYPPTVLQTSYPGMTEQIEVQQPWYYFSSNNAGTIDNMFRECTMQNKLGKVPADFILGITIDPASAGINPRECVAAPVAITPIKYCCIPPRP
ncbi:hypothetical protein KY333_01865 [Candidatus Woesearchaeota archaeon]|nr:hypothetical protein [Candidatus Woesearchaeota archaeon]MBW2993862.1 hypothetical protein [Candidatus Woesearchaeota archaeon]